MHLANDLQFNRPQAALPQPQVSHPELLLAIERIAHMWQKRAQSEAALWSDFKAQLERTRNYDAALAAYSDFSWQRMQTATDDLRRLFEEYRDVLARFPAAKPRLIAQSLFA